MHMLLAVSAVGKASVTAVKFTFEVFLTYVGPLVDLEVLGVDKDLPAAQGRGTGSASGPYALKRCYPVLTSS